MGDVTTVIGEHTRIAGTVTGEEDLTIQGRVEGKVQLGRTLVVEPSGIVIADVEVKNAVISGVVVGNVTATESVRITEAGRMVGDLRAPRVILVAGASFNGRVDMGEGEARVESKSDGRARPTPLPPARPAAPPPRPTAPVRPPASPVKAPVAPMAAARAATPAPTPIAPRPVPRPVAPPVPPIALGKKKIRSKDD